MKTKPWDKNTPEIITKGIDAIQRKYLEKIGESAIRGISLPKAIQLFVLVIKDFKNGILSSDDLADFGFEIFHGVAKNHPKSELFQATLSASELSFAIRSEVVYSNIPQYLRDVDKFYEQHK